MTYACITKIDPILSAIQGRIGFTHRIKEDHQVVGYNLQYPDLFDCPEDKEKEKLLLECRGLIFDKEGNIVSRPLHKFFNVNQHNSTRPIDIPWSEGFIEMEKLDGSMIRPLILQDKLYLGTKAGISETADRATKWFFDNYVKVRHDWLMTQIEEGFTPIFEWKSPQDRIVVDYGFDPSLTLLHIRNNFTGEYINYDPNEVPFDTVRTKIRKVQGFDIVAKEIQDLQDAEGTVIAWPADNPTSYAKMKCPWYLLRHNSIDQMRFSRNIILHLLEETLDDVIPNLSEFMKPRVEEIAKLFGKCIIPITLNMVKAFHTAKDLTGKERFEHVQTLVPKSMVKYVMRILSTDETLDEEMAMTMVKSETSRNLGSNGNWMDFSKDIGLGFIPQETAEYVLREQV